MGLFYTGIVLIVIAVVSAIVNILTVDKGFGTTAVIHGICAIVSLSGIICIIIWLAQLLQAAAT